MRVCVCTCMCVCDTLAHLSGFSQMKARLKTADGQRDRQAEISQAVLVRGFGCLLDLLGANQQQQVRTIMFSVSAEL